jgi:hypothetical protein
MTISFEVGVEHDDSFDGEHCFDKELEKTTNHIVDGFGWDSPIYKPKKTRADTYYRDNLYWMTNPEHTPIVPHTSPILNCRYEVDMTWLVSEEDDIESFAYVFKSQDDDEHHPYHWQICQRARELPGVPKELDLIAGPCDSIIDGIQKVEQILDNLREQK